MRLARTPVLVETTGPAGRGLTPEEARQRGHQKSCACEGADLITKQYVSPYVLAFVHSGLGDKEKTLQLLHEAFDQSAAWIVWLSVDPFFRQWKDEPDFKRIVQRLNLPDS